MQRRTKIALVLLIGLILLLLGLWIFLSPIFGQPAQQPAALTPGTPYVAPATPKPTTATTPTSTPAAGLPVDLLTELQNHAKALIERIGSGSNQDGFSGYQDALLGMTDAGRASILVQQAALQKAHPATGPIYTLTTRAVSSSVTQGNAGDTQISISVQAIQTENGQVPGVTPHASGLGAVVTFVKQADGSYLADSITYSVVNL